MEMIIILSLVYMAVSILDLIPIYQDKTGKGIWIYIGMISFSYILIVLSGLDVQIPSPAGAIKNIVSLFVKIS